MTRAALLALALVALTALSAQTARAGTGPRLKLPVRQVDLGQVVQGAVVETRLRLENAGDAPLVVARAEPSCGCTVVDGLPGPIPPGGAADLVLRFDSSERLGPQHLTVALLVNDPTQTDRGAGCALVVLEADVRTHVRLVPDGAFFGEWVRTPAGAETVVTLAPADPADPAARGLAPRVVGPLPDGVEAAVDAERGPQGEARLRVRLRPDVPAGELFARLVVETGLAAQPRIVVPVVAIVGGRVAGPRVVELHDVVRAAGAERRCALERRDGEAGPIPVLAVRCPSPHVRATVEVAGGRTELVVTVVPDAPPGPFATVVEVVLDDPADPLLVIPVVGSVRPRVTIAPGAALLRPGATARLAVRGGTPTEVEARGAGLTATLEGRTVVVTAAAGWDGVEGSVVVKTEVAGEERLVVPALRH